MNTILVAFVALLFGVVGVASHSCAQDKMRLGLSSVSALHSAVWIAEQKGLFRKHGIEAEVIVTGQGATAGISALLANDIQMTSSAGDALVNAALHGGETVMVAGVVNKGLQRIMVQPEIKTPTDLKGKKVGVTRIGAVSHSVLLMILRRWKMSPTDVQIMQVGSSPNMLASMDKGGLDAAVITIPSMFVAEDRGYKVLLDLADTDIYYLQTMIATTRGYIKGNRDKVLRFLKLLRGHRLLHAKPEGESGSGKKEAENQRGAGAQLGTFIRSAQRKVLRADALSVLARGRNRNWICGKRQPKGQGCGPQVICR
jgi:ABC-type nitrate/sulfonate/bicarbonate transport system substrate-binding protein